MILSDVKRSKIKRKKGKRVGRGPSSGLGKTSGKGQKGQKSRSGYSRNPLKIGGTMPLYRRVSKRGFNNTRFQEEYDIVNVCNLNLFKEGQKVTPTELAEAGIIRTRRYPIPVKILGGGELKISSLSVEAHWFSEKAREKILAANGQVNVMPPHKVVASRR